MVLSEVHAVAFDEHGSTKYAIFRGLFPKPSLQMQPASNGIRAEAGGALFPANLHEAVSSVTPGQGTKCA